ncbi:hypothetical protein FA95DRAFT_403298 [Auriscalpium vulgare]|uniref:Uncharacterized protein n=1 Tax=Auriscalpium vulgare TaxID=40419 RepID=A0ACB8RH43_9AGAM|nr:hypothetical protein FA95DRAFT_403298 [Auriscalpium vulgare]
MSPTRVEDAAEASQPRFRMSANCPTVSAGATSRVCTTSCAASRISTSAGKNRLSGASSHMPASAFNAVMRNNASVSSSSNSTSCCRHSKRDVVPAGSSSPAVRAESVWDAGAPVNTGLAGKVNSPWVEVGSVPMVPEKEGRAKVGMDRVAGSSKRKSGAGTNARRGSGAIRRTVGGGVQKKKCVYVAAVGFSRAGGVAARGRESELLRCDGMRMCCAAPGATALIGWPCMKPRSSDVKETVLPEPSGSTQLMRFVCGREGERRTGICIRCVQLDMPLVLCRRRRIEEPLLKHPARRTVLGRNFGGARCLRGADETFGTGQHTHTRRGL